MMDQSEKSHIQKVTSECYSVLRDANKTLSNPLGRMIAASNDGMVTTLNCQLLACRKFIEYLFRLTEAPECSEILSEFGVVLGNLKSELLKMTENMATLNRERFVLINGRKSENYVDNHRT